MRYQSKQPRRQFLAGVVCPQCQTLDAVVQVRLFEPVADEFIECTQCQHIERRPDAASVATTNQLATSAMQTDANVTTAPVRFIQ